jgi:AraC-like DNA-binding protein
LLVTTNRTIAEIGQEVGFCDQSYFGLIFHKIAGRSPRQFRKESLGGKRGGQQGLKAGVFPGNMRRNAGPLHQ